jgi:hypothetical protein
MIKVIKMGNGDEVLGTVLESISGELHVSRPRVFQVMQGPRGDIQAGLMPWFMSDPDCECVINQDHVVAIITAPKQLEDSYLQQTSSIDLSTKIAI